MRQWIWLALYFILCLTNAQISLNTTQARSQSSVQSYKKAQTADQIVLMFELTPSSEEITYKASTASGMLVQCTIDDIYVRCEKCDESGCEGLSLIYGKDTHGGQIVLNLTIRQSKMILNVAYQTSSEIERAKFDFVTLARDFEVIQLDVEGLSSSWKMLSMHGKSQKLLPLLSIPERVVLDEKVLGQEVSLIQNKYGDIQAESRYGNTWSSTQFSSPNALGLELTPPTSIQTAQICTIGTRTKHDCRTLFAEPQNSETQHAERRLNPSICDFADPEVKITSTADICTFDSDVTITDVTFTGYESLVQGCAFETCKYCPYLPITPTTGSSYVNDLGVDVAEKVNSGEYATFNDHCINYAVLSFITMTGSAVLTLENVVFTGMRQQFNSLIKLQDESQLVMKNVNFENVQAGETVIHVIDHLDENLPKKPKARVQYTDGEVRLMNSGYNAPSLIETSGGSFYLAMFLWAEYADSIVLDNIEFRYNTPVNYFLLWFDQINHVEINNCTFEYNLGQAMILVKPVDYVMEVISDDQDRASLHFQEHFVLTNTNFSNNGATNSIVNLDMDRSELLNFDIRSVDFENNLVESGNIIYLTKDATLPVQEWDYLGCDELAAPCCNGRAQTTCLKYPPRKFSLDDVSFVNNKSVGGVWIGRYPWVSITNAKFQENTSFDGEETIQSEVQSQQNYEIGDLFPSPFDANYMMIFGAEGSGSINRLTMDSVTVTSNSIKLGEKETGQITIMVNTVAYYDTWELSNIELSENNAEDSLSNGVFLVADANFPIFNIENMTVINNTGTAKNGGLQVIGQAKITNFDCQNNESYGNPCITVESGALASVSDSKFLDNTSSFQSSSVLLTQMSSQYIFEFLKCDVRGNKIVSEFGANVFVATQKPADAQIVIRDSAWEQNAGQSNLAIQAEKLQSGSEFTGNTFQNNDGIVEAQFLLEHNSGHIDILNNTFRKNTGSTAVMNIRNTQAANIPTFSSTLQDNVFLDNEAGAMVANLSVDVDNFSPLTLISNKFDNNQGRALDIKYTNLHEQYTTCTNNVGEGAGCIFSISSSVTLEHGTYSKNNGFKNNAQLAGAFQLELTPTIVKNCTISNNLGYEGGVFWIWQGDFELKDSIFEDNIANHGSVIYNYIWQTKTSGRIENCTFTGNTAVSDGAVYILDADIEITNTNFTSNSSGSSSPSIFLTRVKSAKLQNNRFENQASQWGSFYRSRDSKITTDNCTFVGSVLEKDTVGFYIQNSEFYITNSTFIDFYGKSIIDSKESDVIIEHTSIEKSQNFDALLRIQDGSLQLASAIVSDFIFTVLQLFDTEATIDDVDISNGVLGTRYAAIESFDSYKFDINNTNLYNITGGISQVKIEVYDSNLNVDYTITNTQILEWSGKASGGIIAQRSNVTLENVEVRGCNSTTIGGGLTTRLSNTTVKDSIFEGNSATNQGGAMYLECKDACSLNVTNVHFEGNSARSGGALEWNANFIPNETVLYYEQNTFKDNEAYYGPDIASIPMSIALLDIGGESVRRMQDGIPTMDGVPGNILPPIRLSIHDSYENVIKTNQDSMCSVSMLESLEGAAISGHEVAAYEGVCNFDGLIIYSPPNNTFTLELSSNAITESIEGSSNSVRISVYLRNCIPGEVLQYNLCTYCKAPKYSLNPSDAFCSDCPDEAICHGGDNIIPKKGHWRHEKSDDHFYECPQELACLGVSNFTLGYTNNVNWIGECEVGYGGNLCHACEPGYYRIGGKCTSCDENIEDWVAILFICIAFVAVLGVILFLSLKAIKDYENLKPEIGIYLKIMTNYFQVMMVMGSFDVDWPNYLHDYIGIYETTSATAANSMAKCAWPEVDMRDIYYATIQMYFFLPFVILIIWTAVWFLVAMITKNWMYIKQELLATLFVSFFLTYPMLLQAYISHFSCQQLENGNYYMNQNLDERCWVGQHKDYALQYAMPGFILWGVIDAIVIFVYMLSLRSRMEEEIVRKQFSYIINGFRKEYYYWEFVILVRKQIIVLVASILTSQGPIEQLAFIAIILFLSQVITSKYRPFFNYHLNLLEKTSISCQFVTAIVLLFFSTEKYPHDAWITILLFICAIISALIFFGLWFYGFGHWVKEVIDENPEDTRKFLKPFQRCFGKKGPPSAVQRAMDANSDDERSGDSEREHLF